MSELNNIDRLFQEKFKDFEATPSDKVWANIQSTINTGKKETGLLSLWLKLCSFVAVFLIGFSVATTFMAAPFGITNPLSKDANDRSTSGKKTDASENEQKNSIVSSDSFDKVANQNNPVAVQKDEDSNVSNSKDGSSSAFNKNIGGNASEKHHSVNQSKDSNRSVSKTSNIIVQKHTSSVSTAFAKNNSGNTLALESYKMTTDKNKTTDSKSGSSGKTNRILSPQTLLTQKTVNTATANDTRLPNNDTSETDDAENTNVTDAIFDPYANTSKVAYEVGTKYVQNKEVVTRNQTIASTKKEVETNENFTAMVSDSKSKSRNSKLNYNPKGITSTPTDSLTQKQNNKVAEVKATEAEKETPNKDSAEKSEKKSKWIVSTNFSPVYMNLNGSGSTLDSKFDGNSKSYQTSMSYGVGLKYALDKKWSVRTGVNSLNFEYNTNDISYYNSANGSGLEYVNENGNGSGIEIGNPDPKNIAQNENGIVTKRYTGNLDHKINYIEVPVELTYKILNRKFGIEVIGGLSSLVLNDNKVSLVSNDSSTPIGEANNLNKLHFSTNVGMGLRYSFMKDFHANVEPMLKYQINTYKNDAADFKPYFIGVYSGISYSF